MVHGLGGAATNWTDVMDLLRDRLAPGRAGPARLRLLAAARGRRLQPARRTPAPSPSWWSGSAPGNRCT